MMMMMKIIMNKHPKNGFDYNLNFIYIYIKILNRKNKIKERNRIGKRRKKTINKKEKKRNNE